MTDATLGQVVELLYKRSREETELLAKIVNGEISREEVQQMITQSNRSPKERLARALVKKAESAIHGHFDVSAGAPTDVFAEIAAVYELLGEHTIAEKITYRSGSPGQIYLERIKALCEKNDLDRARSLVASMNQHDRQFGWIAIAAKSQHEDDFARVNIFKMEQMDFHIRLAVAVSRAKTDGGEALYALRNETEKHMDHEYWQVMAALANNCTRQRLFSCSRIMIQQLASDPRPISPFQIDTILTLAQTSKDSNDIAWYHALCKERMTTDGSQSNYAACLCNIAAITGNDDDLTSCIRVIDRESNPSSKSYAYSALALAYATCDNIPAARDMASNIIVPKIEALTFARIARIVLSQDSE